MGLFFGVGELLRQVFPKFKRLVYQASPSALPLPREVIEAALVHDNKDNAEAARARSCHFDKRHRLMEAWAVPQARNNSCRPQLPQCSLIYW